MLVVASSSLCSSTRGNVWHVTHPVLLPWRHIQFIYTLTAVMQRDNKQQGSLSVACYVDDELCVPPVDVSPGALCTYHGVPRRNPPRWVTNLCSAISLTHICVQNLESPPANVPTTISAKMVMELETDEVRWLIHVLQSLWRPSGFRTCLKTQTASFQQKQITPWPPWKRS